MIAWTLPEAWMIALRWILLLGPVGLVIAVVRLRQLSQRAQIAGLFAFVYGVAMVFVSHSFAVWIGWWHFGWDALMLNGLPVDIIIGGAVLFGPGLYFSFPNTRPLMMCLPVIIGLHGTLFSSLEPLVFGGSHWFIGVLFVFAIAHLPSLYLAKWTEDDTHLPYRCALLAVMTGGLLFVFLPSLIMQAMGGSWDLFDRPLWAQCVTVIHLTIASLIGVSANQTLCLQGGGTPIPLDPTKRLVTTGIYAYVSNPMQLSAALGCLILGAFLQSVWIMSASVMAWIFVQGMVRWHNRNDLLKRFPEGWPEFKAHVPEWLPRWKPWTPERGTITLCASSLRHLGIASWLAGMDGLDIEWSDEATATYTHPNNIYDFQESCAIAVALMHKNFACALLSHAWLLLALPWQAVARSAIRRHL